MACSDNIIHWIAFLAPRGRRKCVWPTASPIRIPNRSPTFSSQGYSSFLFDMMANPLLFQAMSTCSYSWDWLSGIGGYVYPQQSTPDAIRKWEYLSWLFKSQSELLIANLISGKCFCLDNWNMKYLIRHMMRLWLSSSSSFRWRWLGVIVFSCRSYFESTPHLIPLGVDGSGSFQRNPSYTAIFSIRCIERV